MRSVRFTSSRLEHQQADRNRQGGAMRTEEMLDLVKKASRVSQLHHVTTFRGTRTDKGGVVRDLTIEIQDRGTDDEHNRYQVTATDSGGRVATGNAAPSLDKALEAVRWDDLDAPMQVR
jgi:hypothetical protein